MSLSKINDHEVKNSTARCLNRHCLNDSKIIKALEFVCKYYRVSYKPNEKVCSRCFRKSVKYYKQLINKYLLGVEFPSYVIINSKYDGLQPYSSISRAHSLTDKDVIAGVKLALDYFIQLNETKLNNYTARCNGYLENKLRICKDRSQINDNLIKSSENNLNLMCKSLYAPYRAEHEIINIVDDCDTELVETNDLQVHIDRNVNNDNQEGSTAEEENCIINQNISFITSTDQSNIECLQYLPVKAGQVIYAKKHGSWFECEIRSIINIDHVKLNLNDQVISTKYIAYFEPSLEQFPVGTRIIAKLSNTFVSATMDRFYSGIVAEPRELQNNFRYLIFFDNGIVQYRDQSDIRLIVYKHKQLIEDKDLPFRYQQYLLEYIQKYPERHIISLKHNNLVLVEFKYQWRYAKVLKIDASIVQVRFINFNRVEWLYCGSPRLWGIFDKLSQDPKYCEEFTYLRDMGLKFLNKKVINTSIEGKETFKPAKNSDDGEKMSKPVQRNVAHKRTMKQNNQNKPNKISKLNRAIPKIIKSREFNVHTCTHSCVSWTNYNYNTTKEINMLAIPLHFGFSRIINYSKKKYNSDGIRGSPSVIYIAPCGNIIKNIKDMFDYLVLTKSNMKIDQFDFSVMVNPLAKMQTMHFKIKFDDLSEGKEFKPITCINEINNTLPLPMNYITSRQAMPGVNLNGDFLCGCDCTDNCRDRSKCACCQMTINGQKVLPFLGLNDYEYGRLSEPIVTGIYECNKTCKCNSNCSNRIVQQPLSQMLQLFLTEKKGWGVRCLNDLPKGSFICLFVGEVFTETDATEEGKQFGDEYLADLDYIEVLEQTKKYYESDVIEPNCDGPSWKDFQKTCKDKVPDISLKLEKHDMENISSNSIRQLYGQDDGIYMINAKTSGNIGRYFNHSCSPNTFIQNVFVDTHDLRFPWISIFAKKFIKSGTELTWDYNYQVGSVPDKIMNCYCESKACRGRLL